MKSLRIGHEDLKIIISYINERYFYENALGLCIVSIIYQFFQYFLSPPETKVRIVIIAIIVVISLAGALGSYFARKDYIIKLNEFLNILKRYQTDDIPTNS